MRYVYVKAGDGVEQVQRLASTQDDYRSGPDAYIGEFLAGRKDDDVLVLSRSAVAGRASQFEFQRVTARSYGHDESRLSRFVSALRIGLAMLRWRPDRILCGCTTELLWVSVFAAKLLRAPIINSRHGSLLPRSGLGSIVSRSDRACIRACDAVICNGPYSAHQMREIGIPAAKLFEFRVDLRSYAESATQDLPAHDLCDFLDSRSIVMTFIGRVQRDKGVFDLLEAFSSLPNEAGTLGLIYVGDGKDLAELKQLAARSIRCADILFLGKIDHRKLSTVVRCSSVVVAPTHPTFAEGYPKVVLESLVLGVPVVAPRWGPFPYAITHDMNGLLFEPGDRAKLRQCLAQISISDETLARLQRGARETSERLLDRCTTFGEAVDAAFAVT